jgi:hypothetical protein
MADLRSYLDAATRADTQRSYASTIRRFELEWGGRLPATADSTARYLADRADRHSFNTLRQRLAVLANWHIEQGFADPTTHGAGAKGAQRHQCAASGRRKTGRSTAADRAG